MRLERLDLLAYGQYRATSVDLSAPRSGLTIVCGPNEAGKSTAMRGLVAALFGIPTRTEDDFLHGRAGLRVGGVLEAGDASRVEFVRQGLARAPLVDADGRSLKEDTVAACLSGMGRELYSRLFSIDHRELEARSGDLLDADGEIGRLVFGASLGSGSVTATLRRLQDRAGELYKDGGKNQRVAQALTRYKQHMDDARQARVRSREWDRLQQARADAAGLLDEARGRQEAVRAELSRCTRIRTALPLVARRRELVEQLGALEGAGLVASAEWAVRAQEAFDREEAARHRHDTVRQARDALVRRIEAIELTGEILALGSKIDALVPGIDRYATNKAQLGAREAELDRARRALEKVIGQVGAGAGAGAQDDRGVVPDADLAAVEALVREHAEISAARRTAREELGRVDGAIARHTRHLERIGEIPEVSGLVRAATLARGALTRAGDMRARRAEVVTARQGARAASARLGLGGHELEALEALPVPSAEYIADELGRTIRAAESRRSLDDDAERLAGERAARERSKGAIAAKPDLPDAGALAAARRGRDEHWQRVRSLLGLPARTVGEDGEADRPGAGARVSDPGALAREYEDSVVVADRAADVRYAHAEDLAVLATLDAEIETLCAQEQRLAERLRELEDEDGRAGGEWSARWEQLGIRGGTPSEMSEWRARFVSLLGDIAQVRELQDGCAAAEQSLSEHVETVRAALRSSGSAAPCETLPDALLQADALIEVARDRAAEHREAASELERSAGERTDRAEALAQREAELEEFEDRWARALVPLHLVGATGTATASGSGTGHVHPDAAMAAVRAYRRLPDARDAVETLESRVQGMKRDISEFGSQVGAVLAELPGAQVELDALEVVSGLRERLADAREAAASRKALEGERSEADGVLHAATIARTSAAEELRQVRVAAGLDETGDGAALADVIGRSREVASLREQVARIEATLVQQGDGRTLAGILSEAEGSDGDKLAGELARLDGEAAAIEAELADANNLLGQATAALAAVQGAADAADHEQAGAHELATAAVAADEFARATLSAAVLRQVIAGYAEQHRAPMLDRASEIFSTLTAGAYSELVPDVVGARQILRARRRNTELCTVGALSDGARDQLYFALRLAGIEHHLARLQEPLPVVLDDVLVNFDDGRTAQALRVLADLGTKTQVLLFTHHDWILDAAAEVLDAERLGIVHLEARDHDGPIATRGGDGSAIVDAIRAAGRPLSKTDLLAACDVPEPRWAQVIRRLVDSGSVVQEGAKRGARYRLPA